MTFVFGLAGRICAGKGEAARLLGEEYGARVYRFSDVLKDALEVLDLENTRGNLQELGAALRPVFGEDLLARALKQRILSDNPDVAVVDGVRYPLEAEMVKELGGVLLFIDAPLEARYERAVRRGSRGEKGISLEEFKASDGKATEGQLDDIRGRADIIVENTGSIEEFREKIKEVVNERRLNA